MENRKRAGSKHADSSWQERGNLIFKDFATTPSSLIASFDMDDTLIKIKSGAKWPKSAADWRFWDQSVPQKIQEAHKKGFKIVIFTNQKGISKGSTKKDFITVKIDDIQSQLGIPIAAYIATADDDYRKPNGGMWKAMLENNGKQKVDLDKSFFVGDAAGRKHDFSNTDLLFAKNIGLPFKLPEQFFLGEKWNHEQEKTGKDGFNPKAIPQTGNILKGIKGENIQQYKKDMVLLYGAPGSGKSTFVHDYLPEYSRINRDTLKTKEKCLKVAKQEMEKGNSVVIDNTNPDPQARKPYIELAKKMGFTVRCYIMGADKPTCMHNNVQRSFNSAREHFSKKVGSVIIHTFFKNAMLPTKGQGFDQVVQTNFIGKFRSEKDKENYMIISK